MVDDEEIALRKLRNDEIEGLDRLYSLYAPKVRDFAGRFLKDASEAEDITHDVFLQVWENRQFVVQALSVRAYLFRMTRNAIFNRFKRHQMYQRYVRNAEEEPNAEDLGRRITTEDLLEMVNLAIETLPEQCRKVFKMSRFEHMSYNEIAQALNISPHTVQYHISEALARLRRLLSLMLFFV